MKFTPGPWEFKKDGDCFYVYSAVQQLPRDGSRLALCMIHNESDANLIAAAPEMLEALKSCLPEHRMGDCYSDDYQNLCVCGREKIENVIAKAEGRS